MILVVAVKNPCDPFGSQIRAQMMPGFTLEHYVEAMLPSIPEYYDLAVAIDGHLIEPAQGMMIQDGISLALCVVPQGSGSNNGGKMVLRILGTIVIAAASYYLGPEVAQLGVPLWGLGVGASIAGFVASAAINIAGGLIMNAMLPIQQTKASTESSPTYSYNVTGNAIQEGMALPTLYGTMRIVPPRLAMYVTMNGQEQALHLLFACTGHLLDLIADVKINDTGDLPTNYPEVEVYTRLGKNDETAPIQDFDDTIITLSSDVGLPAGPLRLNWITITTQGTDVQQMGFCFVFYGGCYHILEDGSLGMIGVRIKMEYRKVGDATWIPYESYNTEAETVSIQRWSAGYFESIPNETDNTLKWIEFEEGSQTYADHAEGDKYTPTEGQWYGGPYTNQNTARPALYWRWVDDEIIYPIGTLLESNFVIREANTNPLRFIKYTFDLSPGQYEVRAALCSSDDISTGVGDVRDVYWEWYSEIIKDDFLYPNSSLLAVKSVATSKLANQIPRVSCLATRDIIWVYDTGTSAWASKVATNPAWACYDILVGAQPVLTPGTGTPAMTYVGSVDYTDIDFDAFDTWADWCDLDTPEDYPDKKPYTCNVYLDSTITVRKALDIVGLLGRGACVQQGKRWSCIVEMPESLPVQRFSFNMANIERDSFQEQWMAMEDRANAVQVTYYDAENDYARAMVEVRQSGYDESDEEPKLSSVDYVGCTDKNMATFYGKFLLNCNRYLTLTCSFTAFVDAIACYPGQIIEVQHDVPQFGYGGRCLPGCTTTSLVLDIEVPMTAGKVYHVVVYHMADDLREEKAVTTSAGSHSTIALSQALSRAPIADTRFSFGEVVDEDQPWENWKVAKLMRVLSITYASDLRRKITCIEFVNTVFEDGATIYPQNPSDLISFPFPPMLGGVTIGVTWKLDQGRKDWDPYVRIDFQADPNVDYQHLASPLSKIRVYSHAEAGDTHTQAMASSTFEYIFDCFQSFVEVPAAQFDKMTLFITAALCNAQGREGGKCAVAAGYINCSKVPMPTTSNVTIDSFDYTNNGPSGYRVYFHWVPYGWEQVNGKWAPILTWNNGSNYYVFKNYCVIFGAVVQSGDIPPLNQCDYIMTPDIGNIWDASGVMQTDADYLNQVCLDASCGSLPLPYSEYWVALTAFPLLKNGDIGAVDNSVSDYGLDWEWFLVEFPGGTDNSVIDNQIQNAELVYTMMPGSLFLNEMSWQYALHSPYIDGFALFCRCQPYWWTWEVVTEIGPSETSIVTILTSLDPTTGGGQAAADDFLARYAEWVSQGIPFFYMAFVNASTYEIIKIDTTTLVAERGVEGTYAHTWAVGSLLSYSPCEYIDTIITVPDAENHNYIFNPPVPINFSMHLSIVAFKQCAEAPGYNRCHYAYWDTVQQR